VRAAAIAAAFAHAISQSLQSTATAQINRSITGVRVQLSHLGRNDPTRPGLLQQLNQLRAARATQGSEAAILEPATPASSPVGLNTRRAVEIGLLIGLLLGFGAVMLAENADRRLRTPADLEAVTDLPLLAAIRPSALTGELDTRPEDEEAFHTLRTALTFFNVDKRLESVLVTSAGEQEGKTTVATRLALVTAAAGSRVILVDADLRRAGASARLGIEADAGLGAALVGERSLAESLVEHPVQGVAGGRLSVLPAGPPPPDPAALIGSQAMERLLRELESDSDLVVIDTPAALAVSDPVPLMRLVSGVVVVARLGRARRESVRRLQKVLKTAGGTALGVVATGVSPSAGYEHYSPKYYVGNGANGSGRGRRLAKLR
jgi:capsular exopolysaccharide synthesis family protein